MGKIVKPLLIVGAVAVAAIPGAGPLIGGSLASALLGSSAVGALALAGVSAGAVFGGAIIAAGAAAALGEVQGALTPNPKIQLSQLERLGATVNPAAGRKAVFGARVAMAADIRFSA